MEELSYKIYHKNKISDKLATLCIDLLVKQGKVAPPNVTRIKSCHQIVIGYIDNVPIAIGALKPKTKSDFGPEKANLPNLGKKFVWELGYFYTDQNYRSLGIATTIARLVCRSTDGENIMASTELYSNNSMIYILEKLGFRHYGKPWDSVKHDGTLGLFLKFKAGEIYSNKPVGNSSKR